jgi:hypothetical protein
MAEVYSKVSTCSDRPAGMLEFFFVHIDRDVSVHKVLETASVV